MDTLHYKTNMQIYHSETPHGWIPTKCHKNRFIIDFEKKSEFWI